MERYKPAEIESRLFSPDLKKAKKPYYNLMMFPYPSAEGLHVGNMYAFTGSDIFGRFMRMRGFDVFEPIGLDGFGIHSENYAIKVGRHPKEQAKISEKNFYRQLKATGNAFDWQRTLETYDPDYYKWTQWIFVQMFKHGLAYRKEAEVNFCPSCKTVLADEQVLPAGRQGLMGLCERCSSVVERRELEQWFFKITDYADRLLDGLSRIDWTEKVKIAQRNWIGKKEGIEIWYRLVGPAARQPRLASPTISVFTTRPDTNFGATFIVLAPEHPVATKIATAEQLQSVKEYIEQATSKSANERVAEGRTKTGVFTGAYGINDLNGERMPVWISGFVLMEFGTGAVVGVPGHDKRDFEFAMEFGLPVKRVVVGPDHDASDITRIEQVQEEEGTMVNSDFLNGLPIKEAIGKMMDYLEKKGWGKRVTTYHLRDWLISRQRYWGPPIPIIHCQKCGWQPVPERDLPVLLPDVKDWRPTGTGKSPLASVESFVSTICPNCGRKARRETDVSDTFLDSAWYFFRYISTEFKDRPFDKLRVKKWLPVDMYIGGAEHSVLHLLYSRFLTMVFKDMGLIEFEEPFKRFYAHGLLISEGAKMSKSRGNVVIPDVYIQKYGADTLRCYLMFLGPFSEGGDFRDTGIDGMDRFLKRVWKLVTTAEQLLAGVRSARSLRFIHKTIKKVTEDIENLRYNTAIAALMEWYNAIVKSKYQISKIEIETFLKLLAPFAPHMTEELWQRLESGSSPACRQAGNQESRKQKFSKSHDSSFIIHNSFRSIHFQPWPKYDPKLVEEEEVIIVVEVDGRVRDTMIKNQESRIKNQGESRREGEEERAGEKVP